MVTRGVMGAPPARRRSAPAGPGRHPYTATARLSAPNGTLTPPLWPGARRGLSARYCRSTPVWPARQRPPAAGFVAPEGAASHTAAERRRRPTGALLYPSVSCSRWPGSSGEWPTSGSRCPPAAGRCTRAPSRVCAARGASGVRTRPIDPCRWGRYPCRANFALSEVGGQSIGVASTSTAGGLRYSSAARPESNETWTSPLTRRRRPLPAPPNAAAATSGAEVSHPPRGSHPAVQVSEVVAVAAPYRRGARRRRGPRPLLPCRVRGRRDTTRTEATEQDIQRVTVRPAARPERFPFVRARPRVARRSARPGAGSQQGEGPVGGGGVPAWRFWRHRQRHGPCARLAHRCVASSPAAPTRRRGGSNRRRSRGGGR